MTTLDLMNQVKRKKKVEQQLITQKMKDDREIILTLYKDKLKKENEKHDYENEKNKKILNANRNNEKKRHVESIISIITKLAIEWAKSSPDISKIAGELYTEIVERDHLCGKTHFYNAFKSEEFKKFKDNTQRHSGPNKPKQELEGPVHSDTEVNSSFKYDEQGQEQEPKDETEQSTNITEESDQVQTTPQHIKDARKARDDSTKISSLMGQLLEELTGLSDKEQHEIFENLEKNQSFKIEIAKHSETFLFQKAKQIPDGDINYTIGLIQALNLLVEKYKQMLSDEVISRKKIKEMTGI